MQTPRTQESTILTVIAYYEDTNEDQPKTHIGGGLGQSRMQSFPIFFPKNQDTSPSWYVKVLTKQDAPPEFWCEEFWYWGLIHTVG